MKKHCLQKLSSSVEFILCKSCEVKTENVPKRFLHWRTNFTKIYQTAYDNEIEQFLFQNIKQDRYQKGTRAEPHALKKFCLSPVCTCLRTSVPTTSPIPCIIM